MASYLYPCFKWPGTIWFYSDPQFGDEDMKYFRPSFITDDYQIKSINKKVGKTDTIVMLGDIGDPTKMKQLRGYKVLIKGNHDTGTSNYKDYFDEIYEGCLMIRPNLILSHEPVNFDYAFNVHGHDHSGQEFKEHVLKYYDPDMGVDSMVTNYLKTIKRDDLTHLNICAEWINYTPINLKTIIKNGLLHSIPDIHRVTIDNASGKW